MHLRHPKRKQYLENCRQVLAAVEDAGTALIAGGEEPAGNLVITAPILFGQMYVALSVTRFVQRYDKMRCNVVLLDRVVNLLASMWAYASARWRIHR